MDQEVVTDGNLITSRKPEDIPAFSRAHHCRRSRTGSSNLRQSQLTAIPTTTSVPRGGCSRVAVQDRACPPDRLHCDSRHSQVLAAAALKLLADARAQIQLPDQSAPDILRSGPMTLLWLRLAVLSLRHSRARGAACGPYDRPRWRHSPSLRRSRRFSSTLSRWPRRSTPPTIACRSRPTKSNPCWRLSLGWRFSLVYARYRSVSIGIFVLPIAFLLATLAAFRPGQETFSSPIRTRLDSAAHRAAAGGLRGAVACRCWRPCCTSSRSAGSSRSPRVFAWLPPLDTPLETIDQIALKTLLFGLPCMTAGLLIGSVIAQQDYGAKYFSDPKILLTFVLWLAYVAMIFIRRASGSARAPRRVSLQLRRPGRPLRLGRQPVFRRPQVPHAMSPNQAPDHRQACLGGRDRSRVRGLAGAGRRQPHHRAASRSASGSRSPLRGLPTPSAPWPISPASARPSSSPPATASSSSPARTEPRAGRTRAASSASCTSTSPSPADTVEPHLYEFREREAIRHLFRVASSLDSHGRWRTADPRPGERVLHRRARSWRGLRPPRTAAASAPSRWPSASAPRRRSAARSVSIASVAVDLARKIFGSLQGKTVLLVGAGKMSELAARHLIQQGATSILVANRTQEGCPIAGQIAEQISCKSATTLPRSCSTEVIPFDASPRAGQPRRYRHHLDRRRGHIFTALTASSFSSAAATGPCSSSTSPSPATSTRA